MEAPPIVHLGDRRTLTSKGAIAMLYTIAVILLIAWLLGFVGIYTIGSFVHVLLVVAIVLFLVGLLSGRRTLA
jgi:asparagine N-glycosylation enzyme membrane subunit Stt3